ncbi:MAG: FAD-linked oxidase C-terminal domain-containing protein [Anaerolineales bacterium]
MITGQAIEASQEFIRELRLALSEVYFDRLTRLLYSTDASIYQMMPVGVVIPRDTDEIIAAVEIAGRHGVPVLPRGGGSSLAGQTVGHALVLDLSRHMDRILEIDPEAKIVRTQPGITLGVLTKSLSSHGLMFGPDPASGERATMGGILGNNSAGAHSIVYGMTVDHVHSTDVVLADGSQVHLDDFPKRAWETRGNRTGSEGTIYQTIFSILHRYSKQIATRYPKVFRHVAGYNLNQLAGAASPNLSSLIVGSEGTLGIITEMKLNLVPIPMHKRLAMVHFSDLRAALEAVPVLLESRPAVIEVLDKMLLDLTRDRKEFRRWLTFVQGDPQVVLMIEYAGESDAEVDAGVDRLKVILNQINHHDPVVLITDPAEQATVWFVRKCGLGILMSTRGNAKPIPFIEDAAVPVQHLADYATQIYSFAAEVGVTQVAMYAHASAGCIHIRPLINLKTPDGVRHLRQVAEKSVELVIKYGGTTSGEHGEGLARGEFSERLFGTELVQAFREVKAAFDPEGLMNPGKVIDVPKMDDEKRLRFGSDYTLPLEPHETTLSFTVDQGFAGAVEMCNGAGVCRQLDQGVMCPPFQILRQEAHSTRGRANALRAAMMGLLGPDGMTSTELYHVLDLCLSCHACKSECPSAVDMAKLKAEFLNIYYKKHGTPLRARLFGNIAKLYKLGQPLSPIANFLINGPAKLALTGLGIHPKRSLPALATQSFSEWHKKHSRHDGSSTTTRKQVILFHDTFMEHNDPHIGQAAIKVLETAGFEPVILHDKVCCGRPEVSKGLLEDAKKLAQHNINLLAPYASQGIPIVGCEPSCMTMLVNEYPDLVPGSDADVVAEAAMMIDEFLVQEAGAGNLSLQFDDAPRGVLFHGHCQQKAIFGTESTHSMLQLIPNCRVEEIEAGCCGMAGSFGYEKEHYDLSIEMAEMSLAPVVRAASPDTIICAMGTSCREQIRHTTDRRALHPIEVMAEAMIVRPVSEL